jgi:hypothetical protein
MSPIDFGRGRRNILGRDEANRILSPHFDDLILSVNAGMDHFAGIPDKYKKPFSQNTKARMLYDAIRHDAMRRFDGVRGVVIDDQLDSLFLIFRGELAIRFKKSNKAGKTRNILTERQVKLRYQQLVLPGFRQLTTVSLGYGVNPIWTEISRMRIYCRFGEEIQWSIPLIEGMQARKLPGIEKVDDQSSPPAVRSKRRKQEGA